MATNDLHYLTIAEAAQLIQAGKLSPVELTQVTLQRIKAHPELKAYITVLEEPALAAARSAEQEIAAGRYRGPLHGVPIALKDLVNTKGVRTTGGSKILKDNVPAADGPVVEKLHAAGAVVLGKLNMFEFAYGPTGINPHYGTPQNPWDSSRMPGGSSSGSGVAVAAGLCAMAIGSDTGGSIRIPASLCGIVGLKPTYGRVSRREVLPLSWSLDHLGPMARSVEDAALSLNVMAGYDPLDPGSANVPVPDYTRSLKDGVRGLRIGVARQDFFDGVDAEVIQVVEAAAGVLRGLGADVRDVPLPFVQLSGLVTGIIIQAEAATYHLPTLREHWDEYDPSVRARLLPGLTVGTTAYLNAQRARALLTEQMRAAFDQVDVFLAPTEPFGAPRITPLPQDQGRQPGGAALVAGLTMLNRPGNMSGFPALSLPCGFTSERLPIGLQLIGKPWDEATMLRAGYAYEQATEWHTLRPLP